jgi:hypothetical protein
MSLSSLKALATRARVMHYVDIFLAAFGMALLYNQQDLLGAHGLNAVKSVVFAASVAGGKAVFEAFRKSTPKKAAPPAA